jgi:hypothetical protein
MITHIQADNDLISEPDSSEQYAPSFHSNFSLEYVDVRNEMDSRLECG